MKIVLIYLLAVVIFFCIDMVWIGVLAKNFYREKLSFVFTGQINWTAAVIFYLIYIGGILYFAVLPGANWQTALQNGAVLGLLCYATYDLTNMATIPQWPLIVVIADIIWGIVLTGSVSAVTVLLGQRFGLL